MKNETKNAIKEKIESVIEQQTKIFIKNLPSTVKSMIESSMLSLLGLEKRYSNQYEIDHCNGRASVLVDAIRNLALEEAKQLVKGSYKPTKEELALFRDAFKKEYERHIRYYITEWTKQKAEADAKAFIEEVSKDALKELSFKLDQEQ